MMGRCDEHGEENMLQDPENSIFNKFLQNKKKYQSNLPKNEDYIENLKNFRTKITSPGEQLWLLSHLNLFVFALN